VAQPDVIAVMATMRAMRRLKPDPVPADLLERLIEAASFAPSSQNQQAAHYILVTDREQMKRVAAIWQAAVQLYLAAIATEPPDMSDRAVFDRTLEALRWQSEHFTDTPALVVACYDMGVVRRVPPGGLARFLRALTKLSPSRAIAISRNRGSILDRTAAASIYPGVQNLLLAARSLGLGANVSLFPIFFEPELKAVLGIPRHVRPFAAIPIGWPIGTFGPVRRRALASILHRDRW
jgi:nitroreductase